MTCGGITLTEVRLNLGSGKDVRPGWINLDFIEYPGVLCWDLNTGKLPFEDGTFDEILASHVLEHLDNYEAIVIEAYRVLKPKGVLVIRVPYGTYGFGNLYHKRYFNERTMDVLCTYKKKAPSLQEQNECNFIKERCQIRRDVPFNWHMEHYLGFSSPIGRKIEIVWTLRKPNGTK